MIIIFADGHTASNTPDLFRPPKLSGAGPGQYWGGGPPGKTLGCCQLLCVACRIVCAQDAGGSVQHYTQCNTQVARGFWTGALLLLGCMREWLDQRMGVGFGITITSWREKSAITSQPRTCEQRSDMKTLYSLTAIPRRMHRISSDLRS